MRSDPGVESIYIGSALAKTGCGVPVFANGKPANSLYNPAREAEKSAARFPPETFAVFAGLADGRRVELFLNASPANECIIIEKNRGTFQFLQKFPAAASAMQNRRARLFSFDENQGNASSLKKEILAAYIPALFRSFSLDILLSWQACCPNEAAKIKAEAEDALSEISADFSVQAHFGKIWIFNALKNIYNCSINRFDTDKTAALSLSSYSYKRGKKALVAAAGPSLDAGLTEIMLDRESLAVFAADTALPALSKRGITADFVLSIDPQILSARHFVNGFGKGGNRKTVLIMDICGCPSIAERAGKFGHSVLFVAGGHPLASCMASFMPMPRLETAAGTVTASAMDAAKKLGFKEIITAGADFAFTDGKPYCRGTYLEEEFFKECSRIKPAETMYAELMFKSPVRKEPGKNGALTYKTDLLERYKKAVEKMPLAAKEWGSELQAESLKKGKCFFFFFKNTLLELNSQIASETKKGAYKLGENLSKEQRSILVSLFPLASFFRKKKPGGSREDILKSAINLALNIVERYTD